jgi:ankyrin repeat protein
MSNAYSLNYTLIFNRFLFVDLNIRYLCKQPTGRHILTELERLQKAQTTDKLMDPTYDRIVDAVRNQPTACETLAIRTLAWIVKAQRVLKINELQIAVSLEADMTKLEKMDMLDEGKLIDSCHGLIVMDATSKTVRLAHFTTQEYLNRKGIIPQNSDTTLAIACTTYLCFDKFKTHDCPSCINYFYRCDIHSFFEYAVENLSFHINSSNQESTVAVFGRFLENEGNVSSYLKIHSSRSVFMPGKPLSLLVASALGHTVMVKHLLQKGYDISTTDQELTALHLASGNGHLELVKLLLENGANPNAVNESNDTPLHKAVENGYLDLVKLLLENGANPNAVGESNNTPLHKAAANGDLDLVGLLLENGANPNAVGELNYTPLHTAVENGDLDLVELLLENKANPNAVSESNDAPLHKAAENGDFDLVELLLENGANPNAVVN